MVLLLQSFQLDGEFFLTSKFTAFGGLLFRCGHFKGIRSEIQPTLLILKNNMEKLRDVVDY
jgi:hypothetical protein